MSERLGALRASSLPAPALAKPRTTPVPISARGYLVWFALAFVVSFGIVWLYVATLPMAFFSRDYPLLVAKQTLLNECRLGEVTVFGDSRAVVGIMPRAIAVPVANLAYPATTPIETYFMLRRALRCPRPPKLVVIAHSPLKYASDWDYWKYIAPVGLLDYAEMREIDRDAAELHDTELQDLRRGDQLPPALRDWLFTARFPALYFDSLVNGFVAARWRHNLEELHDTLQASGQAHFGTDSGSSGVAYEATRTEWFKPSPLVDSYFSRTLALLAERRIPVVLLTMPVNHATYSQMRPELQDWFAGYLGGKAKRFPMLRVDTRIPCWPDAFFGDPLHFNARGTEAYSRQFGAWLQDLLAGAPVADMPDRCGAR